MFASSGQLRYVRGPAGGYKLTVEVDQGIVNYYRSMMPKWIDTNSQMYAAHISVVRKEVPPLTDAWGRYEGELVEFFYQHTVYRGEVYFWLNVFSTRLEDIRVELGLPIDERYTPPPPGFRKTFHVTVANCKGK